MTPSELLLGCCASTRWVAAVIETWPYPDLAILLSHGEKIWWGLDPADWREALAAHPRIGDRPAVGSQERREQSGAEDATMETLAAIAAGNRRYEQRFGMTYVVRATGRTAPEMLALLHERLTSCPDDELRRAAEQQWEITAVRLTSRWGDA